MAERGTLHGVADEGGWWRVQFGARRRSTLAAAIERPG
jgi:hypothetical protein